jgi:D-alanyl-D-alanine endopeptidase (penicillin-binding protein 7)
MRAAIGNGVAGLILGSWLAISPVVAYSASPQSEADSAKSTATLAAAGPQRTAEKSSASKSKQRAKSASVAKTRTRTSSKIAAKRPYKRAGRTPQAAERPTIGRALGLHTTPDKLDLRSSVALVSDSVTGEILFEKNALAVLPIASITKLMTAMVVLDSQAPMGDMIQITNDDVDTERGSRSRLRAGVRLSRSEMLQLALMSSENRAANALGRNHPQGLAAFVEAMNTKARSLGMHDTAFVEPTGLSSSNVSNARDLAKLVRAAANYPQIREFSTASELTVDTGYRQIAFHSTNRLVSSDDWDIDIQKTGYISEAGRCLVMQVQLDGRPTVMVLLDSSGRYSRFGDARRVRTWLEAGDRRALPRTIS